MWVFVGTSLQVSAPVGAYEDDKLINFGANRWMVRPGIGMSYEIGRWHVDGIASVWFFEDNDDYFEGFMWNRIPSTVYRAI